MHAGFDVVAKPKPEALTLMPYTPTLDPKSGKFIIISLPQVKVILVLFLI